ncbi:uncharacterized protein LOC121371226 [Gigantopelta aegis]|uniref:uncharacterized protein LOC121371226 n=1 Tax=Gigantopelta aegis TaxID=1735272 RepID=UPI001B88AC2B|nr:uncharacterized protein LOC121371226 [Gigantopelta aegis]
MWIFKMKHLIALMFMVVTVSSSLSCDNDVIVTCEVRWENESKEAGNNEQKTCESAMRYLSCIEPYGATCFDPDRMEFNKQLRSYAYGKRCFANSSTIRMTSSTFVLFSLISFFCHPD